MGRGAPAFAAIVALGPGCGDVPELYGDTEPEAGQQAGAETPDPVVVLEPDETGLWCHSLPPTEPIAMRSAPGQSAAPITGGTLYVTPDGHYAVAAQVERDVVHVVDLRRQRLVRSVALPPRSEPGRLVGDAEGRIHVVLRRGGGLASFDLLSGEAELHQDLCSAPRGLAYDPAQDQLHLSCADGQLLTLDPADGAVLRRLHLPRDLRDVVVDGELLLVSRFRSAHLLVVEPDGTVRGRSVPNVVDGEFIATPGFPTTSWRLRPRPGGGAIMSHQTAFTDLPAQRLVAYYGPSNGCTDTISDGMVTVFGRGGQGHFTSGLGAAYLPVDLAVDSHGERVAVVVPSPRSWEPSLRVSRSPTPSSTDKQTRCRPEEEAAEHSFPDGAMAVAVAFDALGQVVVQTRDPARIHVLLEVAGDTQQLYPVGEPIELPESLLDESGLRTFHTATGSGVACASCHPEGGDDGLVWNFPDFGLRRTPPMHGGLLKTAPFHWSGDLDSVHTLVDEVFVGRMAGQQLELPQIEDLAHWMDGLPGAAAPVWLDTDAISRGREIFYNGDVGCACCHTGSMLTNNQTMDVGSGGRFQVPSLLGLSNRGPFMHDGCAGTLRERFDPACGGGDLHGTTSHLSAEQIGDLIAYLETL